VISIIFQFKSKFSKLSGNFADLLKSTDYFNDQQNSTAAENYSTDEVYGIITVYGTL